MNFFSLLRAGLRQHAKVHVAVAFGVAAATAVLTGALLVGDSVRGSLRDLALDGLGRIDFALVAPHFFRQELATEVADLPVVHEASYQLVPAILLSGNLKCRESERLATSVQVLGTTDAFWPLRNVRDKRHIAAGEVVLNTPLADELGAKVGHQVILRLPQANQVPPDSPLGRKVDTLRRIELTVSEIIPAAGLGRFTLFPSQQSPRNAYVNLESLQGRNRPAAAGEINAMLLAADPTSTNILRPTWQRAPNGFAKQLVSDFRPGFADLGLTFEPLQYQIGEERVTYAWQLSSQRMLLEPHIEREALAAWHRDGAVPVYTYLANSIAAGEKSIPYSTITAVDSTERLGPAWFDRDGKVIGPLEKDEIVLNDWAARDLGVDSTPGAEIAVTYFEPETTHGEARERTATFRLKGIVALTPPKAPARRGNLVRFAETPTPATDANWTPEVEGITDKDMRDWDAPFPYDQSRIRPEDDDYWNEYHTTPKAFVSFNAGRKLWGSRFGSATSVRIPYHRDSTTDGLASRVTLDPAKLGMEFRPVRAEALQAAGGTTQFEQLFLGFSCFIIAAAALLIAILVRLGLEQRASEIGILMASGWPLRRVRRLFWAEGAVAAMLGGIAGVALGVLYCRLMLAALTSPSWWLGAVGAPFLKLHLSPQSLAIGGFSGMLISLAVIALALRPLRQASVRQLLAGQMSVLHSLPWKRSSGSRWWSGGWALLALGAVAAATRLSGEAQAGAFLGGGALLLTSLLLVVRGVLRTESNSSAGGWGLRRLAGRNAGRHPGRSTLTIGLVAAASFLIIALSAFRLNPNEALGKKSSGSGGFALLAESDQPIFPDLGDALARAELGFADSLQEKLQGATVVSLRVQAGDDASCLNLFQAARPRLLGVPMRLVERGGFAWAGTSATTTEEIANPWRLLGKDLGRTPEGRPIVPVVIDQATAIYSLHLSGVGATYNLEDGRGQTVALQVVGLLKNSLLQGSLIVSEQQLTRLFPDSSGYRMFLIALPAGQATGDSASGAETAVAAGLESALEDFGFDAVASRDRLAALMSVQNTYLSTFQSLGGLGLLLGTFGLAAVQLRNVLERRGELALMRAAGFRPARLTALVMLENASLLLGGLAVGVLSALIVVFPHWLAGGAAPPWMALAMTLAAVAGVGAMVSLTAVRAQLKAAIVPALRGD